MIEQALESENTVKIKGLGTFKLIDVDSRESVNVNTGERFQIKGHTKVSFSPDANLRDTINKPFAHFETVVLNENTVLEDTPIEETEEEESGEEVIPTDIPESIEPQSQPKEEEKEEMVSYRDTTYCRTTIYRTTICCRRTENSSCRKERNNYCGGDYRTRASEGKSKTGKYDSAVARR